MRFHRPQIADCPKCGCNDVTEIGDGSRCECGECGYRFGVEKDEPNRVVKYLEKRIPICPVHNVPMHNNGKPNLVSSRGERSVYYKCPSPGCSMTDKGNERIV